ncbi:hypothetical protein BCR44DRAFT_1435543 [Catenaria anguillulae PL171]|uniref:Uncharacterized protein n=1 Tax=Catenaria anguillulae PL171 TaxID=765915 RepID=A0A1Y2HK66_9FUNG|nr:hypothetical protein BCR44DRAFT_1435543 [Catenaria anguillulae PL171]
MLAEMDLFDTEILARTPRHHHGAPHPPTTQADVDRAVDRGRAPSSASPHTHASAPDWHSHMQLRSDLASATATVARLESQLADSHAQMQEYMNKLVDQRAAERTERTREQAEHDATVQRMWERAACEAAGLVGELRARVGEERDRLEGKCREASEEAARWRREGKEARQAVDEVLKAGKVKGVDGAHGKSKDAVPLAEYARNAFAAVVSKAQVDRDEAVAKVEKRMRKVEEERDAMERDLMDCAGLIAGHEDKLAVLERGAQGLREEVGREHAFKTQVEEQAKQMEALRGELDALIIVTSERDELERAESDKKRVAAELEQAVMNFQSTQSQLASASQQLAAATDDLAAAQAANSALDSTAQRQKKEIKKLSQRIRDLEKQSAKSLELVQESLTIEAVARNNAERDRDTHRSSAEEIASKHATKLAEYDALAQHLKDAQVTIELDTSKSHQRDRLAADLSEKQTELHRSRLRSEELSQQLRMVESQAASATAQPLDAAVTARTRADAELDRARKEIAVLQATVQEYEQLGDHVGVAAASAGSAMRELDSARRRISDLEQEAEGLRSQVRELEAVLRTWTAERDSSYRVTGALRAQVAFWRERAEGRGAGSGAGGGVSGALGSGALIGSSPSSSASSVGSSAGGGGATSTATSAARRFGRLFS